jgi:outer membrane protein assembly factor BamB
VSRVRSRSVTARVRAGFVAFVLSVTGLSAVVGLSNVPAAGAAGCAAHTAWTTFGFDNARSGRNPCETTLSVSTVPHLHLLWSANLTSVSIAQPTYAPNMLVKGVRRNLLFVADEHGLVQALDASTGAQVWQSQLFFHQSTCTDIPDQKFGVSGAPVLDLSTATGYVVGGGGDAVHAIDLTTGQDKPGWKPISVGNAQVDHVYGALTLASGILYATTASYCDFGTYYGKTTAINVATDKIVAQWYVVPTGTSNYGGGIWGPGGVSVDNANAAVYAATGNSLPGEHAAYGERVVRLNANLVPQASNYTSFVGQDVDYGATPLLFQPPSCPAMLVAKNKSGVLVVYDRNSIASGPVQKIQVADPGNLQFNGIPAYSSTDNKVYLTNSSDSTDGVYFHGMVAFKILSNCTLGLAWQRTVGPTGDSISPPTVANGVVYYGDGSGDALLAFNAATGARLWNSNAIQGSVYAAPTVVDGKVFAAAWDGKVYAFGT